MFSHSVLSNSLQTHGLWHARLLCPSPSPGACSNSCSLSRRCHPTILCPPLFPRVCSNSSLESMMLSNYVILCRPLLLLPSIFSSLRVFSNELTLCIRWPKDWNFSFSNRSSNNSVGLISFQNDWFDLLAVQGILKSLLQCQNLKASVLQCSVFFTVQVSHPCMKCTKKSQLCLYRPLSAKWCVCLLMCYLVLW